MTAGFEHSRGLRAVRDLQNVGHYWKASGFFITEALEQQLLERHRTRRATKR